MNTVVKTKFAVKPVVAAVALAVSAGGALADPNINALPGGGLIRGLSPGASFFATNYTVSGGGAVGDTITNAAAGLATITLAGAGGPTFGVIQWGGAGAPIDAVNPNGFNIGSAAKLTFATGTPAPGDYAILNIDASKNPSQIFGQLEAAPSLGDPDTLRLFVSNANGIIVGPAGQISLPNGGGLIGADLNNATSIDDFIANNSTGVSYINYSGGLSEIWIQKGGSITGDLVANIQARYILLAGGNVVNEGNLFGEQVDILAGMIASPGKATVNLVANTVVNRLFSTQGDGTTFGGFSAVDGDLGAAAPNISLAPAPVPYAVNSGVGTYGTVINLGNITSEGGDFVGITASHGIRSGTLGDGNLLVGINSDGPLVLNTFTASAKIELYNVVSGYIVNPIMPFLNINQSDGADGDVIINALTPASQPSSITTLDDVNIAGGDITISSTINHLVSTAGGKNTDASLVVDASESLTVTANIGAGNSVFLTAEGPMTISGNVLANTDSLLVGGIFITNNGSQSGNTTTISGNLTVSKSSPGDIHVYNNGQSNSKLIITGNITTWKSGHGDVEVYSRGLLDLGGTILGDDDVNIAAYGNSVMLRGPITADNSGDGDGLLSIAAPIAQTKVHTAALLTAPTVLLGFDGTNAGSFPSTWVGIHNFTGVQNSGASYTAFSQKPATQIMTDNLVLYLLGSFNAPVNPLTNTNWLLNSMPISPLDPTRPVAISLSAVGAGFQAVNMHVDGDLAIDSGVTFTPFIDVPLTSGFFPAGGLIGNGGSQVIVRASGDIDIVGSSGAQESSWGGGPGYDTGSFPFGNAVWQWPGGTTFIAGTDAAPGTLNQFVPMYNAWTITSIPFGGIFLEAATINAFGYYALNGNSWVNFSTLPTAGVPLAYQIRQFGDGVIFPIGFGFEQTYQAPHLNTYSQTLLGAPINNCPIPPGVC